MAEQESTVEGEPEREALSLEAQREGFTMAMYTAITLMAVLVAETTPSNSTEEVLLILGTVVGIVAAHFLAFRLAARLFTSRPEAGISASESEASHSILKAAAGVAVLAVAPYLILPTEPAAVVSLLLLALVIGVGSWFTAKAAKATNGRALIYALIVTAAALAVAIVKALLSH